MTKSQVWSSHFTLKQTNCISTESCAGRCNSFDPQRKCQCDSMCVYYGSCCPDFESICPRKSQYSSRILSLHWTDYLYFYMLFLVWQHFLPSAARGDTFQEADEVTEAAMTPNDITTTLTPTFNTVAATSPASPPPTNTPGPTTPVDPDAAPCSGRPFDAFLQLKNGSIYAFRGKHGHWDVFLSS